MDSNLKQAKKELLSLEARHSKCIEASNKIRSKLSPRLFLPRTPIRGVKILRNENLTHRTITKDITKESLKVKYTINPQRDKYPYSKAMANDNIHVFRNSNQINIKTLKIQQNQNQSDFRNFMLALDMSKLENPMQNITRILSNKDHDTVINLADSPTYLGNDELVFCEDLVILQSPNPLNKDEDTNAFQNLQTNVEEFSTHAGVQNSLEPVTKTNDNSSNDHKSSQPCNYTGCKNTTTCNKISVIDDSKTKVKPNFTKPVAKRYTASARKDSPNIRKKKNSKNLSPEMVAKDDNLNNNTQGAVGEDLTKLTIGISAEKTYKKRTKNVPTIKACTKKKEQQIVQIARPLENVVNNNPTKQLAATDVPNDTRLANLNNKYYLARNALKNYLDIKSTSLGDFQKAVRSSISQTYDKKINEDLINLENYVEDFSKHILQCYMDVDSEILKTDNCLEYLRKKGPEYRTHLPQNSPQNNTSNQPNSAGTFTILIDAEKMPTKSITYKMSDILCPEVNSVNNDGTIKNSVVSLETNNSDRKRKNTDKAKTTKDSSNAIQINKKLHKADNQNQGATMVMPKAVTNLSGNRENVLIKVSNSSTLSNCQNETTATTSVLTQNSNTASFQQNYPNNTLLYPNQYNLNYTQALNNCNPYPTTNFASPISSQALAESPVSVVNFYNYALPAENVNSSAIPPVQYYLPYLPVYPQSQNISREQPNRIQNVYPNHFGYQQSIPRMPYLQNPYTEAGAYHYQMENNYNTPK